MNFKKHHSPPEKGCVGPRIMFLSKLFRTAFNQALSQQGLFSGQQDIILEINENEGMTVGQLAKKLEVSVASMSVSIKRMEKNGFIIRTPDENDARIIRLYPTQRSKQAPIEITEKMNALEATVKQGMTDEQAEYFTELLDIAISNLLKRGDENC